MQSRNDREPGAMKSADETTATSAAAAAAAAITAKLASAAEESVEAGAEKKRRRLEAWKERRAADKGAPNATVAGESTATATAAAAAAAITAKLASAAAESVESAAEKKRRRLEAWKQRQIANKGTPIATADPKIDKRRERLEQWKRSQAVAAPRRNDDAPEEIDPLDAFMAGQEAVAKADIQASIEKSDKEAAIVAAGGTLEDSKKLEEDSLVAMMNANKHCFICKKMGHTKRDCPERRCSYCFEVGHERSDCAAYTAEIKRRSVEEKKRKRERQYANKKSRKKEEWTHKLRCETGIYGFETLYKVLGLPPRRLASRTQIKKAYQAKSLIWHPDKWAMKSEDEQAKAADKFLEIKSAYELLLEGMETGGISGSAVFSAGELQDFVTTQVGKG